MNETLVAIFDGEPNRLRLARYPTPVARAGEILVRVSGCTLCGSDLHSHTGRRQVAVPTLLGHEIVGVIEAFGEADNGNCSGMQPTPIVDLAGQLLRIGDRITWAIVASCGECFYCQHDLPQKCTRSVKYGHEKFLGDQGFVGGLSQHCLLARNTAVVRLPDSMPLEAACPASCATATVTAALDAADPPRLDAAASRTPESANSLAGETVLVIGAGLLGVTACAMSRIRGADHVICLDVNTARRERALDFGATHCVSPGDVEQQVLQLTERRGADVVLEFSGSSRAFETAWPLARIGGRFVLVGSVFPDEPVPIQLEQIVRRQLSIRGIHNYAPRHLLSAVRFLECYHDRFPFAELVDQWYPLDQIADAFNAAHEPTAIRIGVRP